MPTSRKRAKKKSRKTTTKNTSRSHRGGGRSSYSPGTLAIDEGVVFRVLDQAPVDRLPYIGLASWYLISSPLRSANQCLLACVVLREAMMKLGIESELRGLLLDVQTGSKTVSYGNPSPHINSTDELIGHVGLLAGNTFIDPTAAQFPAIRNNGGVRPIVGVDPRLSTGSGPARIGIPLGTKMTAVATYTVLTADSTATVEQHFMQANDRDEIDIHASNLLLGLGVVLAGLDTGRVAAILKGPHRGLADLVASCQGMTADTTERLWVLRPQTELLQDS